MELQELKKEVLIKSVLSMLTLSILLAVLYYLYSYNIKLMTNNSYFIDKIYLMNDKINKIHTKKLMLTNNTVLWKEIRLSNIYSNNSYIQSLDSLIKKLCQKYQIFDSVIILYSPVIIDKTSTIKYVEVVKNTVDIKFSSISDEHVFLFLNAIKYDISGYIIFESFNLVKNQEITNEVIQKAERGDPLYTVSGSLVFNLHSILDEWDNKIDNTNDK